jgi:methylphosphotriester-DNA--protein-cysteine methyltransferase
MGFGQTSPRTRSAPKEARSMQPAPRVPGPGPVCAVVSAVQTTFSRGCCPPSFNAAVSADRLSLRPPQIVARARRPQLAGIGLRPRQQKGGRKIAHAGPCGVRAGASGARSGLRRLVLHRRADHGRVLPPVCPVRPARPANVRFYPFCPAWKGSRATVERAARLIVEEGALDGDGASVAALAERLGVGARHLARLFSHHLGASPVRMAKTARVQRAKRLLDQTDLPMTEVALRAGFGSLRRFNAVFAEVYGRPPTEIRRRALGRAPF